MSLLPLDEASRRLRAAARAYRGIHPIPIDRIVGSVDRSDDFDRDFRPRRALSLGRYGPAPHGGGVGCIGTAKVSTEVPTKAALATVRPLVKLTVEMFGRAGRDR